MSTIPSNVWIHPITAFCVSFSRITRKSTVYRTATSYYASMGMWCDSLRRIPPVGFFFLEIEWLDHAEGAPTRFMVASGGNLSEGCGYFGPGVCLGDDQTETYLKDMGMTGLASVWAMARRRPKEYRHKVDAATRCPGVCPHTRLDLTGSHEITIIYNPDYNRMIDISFVVVNFLVIFLIIFPPSSNFFHLRFFIPVPQAGGDHVKYLGHQV